MLIPEEILDGYKLVRQIGVGGFGEVWLCRIEATREWKALKFLPASASRHLEQELEALIRYRSVTARLQCAHLLPIEHVNRDELRGLYYTMPLADGLLQGDPLDTAWRPKTLAALIEERRSAPGWFLPEEILQFMLSILDAAQRLSDAGVVHRDIKPENLLFVGGQLVLGDISLLGTDEITLSGRGTPGYAPPSWYLESQGNPDMWGVATTFYSLLTGNAPDKVGRGAFLWPPQGEGSVDGTLWRRWHKVVLRATQENPMERFLSFDAIAEALRHGNGGFDLKEHNPSKIATLGIAFLLLVLASIGGWEVSRFWKPHESLQPARGATPPAIMPPVSPSLTPVLPSPSPDFPTPTPTPATPSPIYLAPTAASPTPVTPIFTPPSSTKAAQLRIDAPDANMDNEVQGDAFLETLGLLERAVKTNQHEYANLLMIQMGRQTGPVLFSIGSYDLHAWESYIRTLKVHEDSLSEFVWENLRPETRNLLDDDTAPTLEKVSNLIGDLNKLLKGDCIYNRIRFKRRSDAWQLSKEDGLKQMIAEKPRGTRHVFLNRWIFSQGYGCYSISLQGFPRDLDRIDCYSEFWRLFDKIELELHGLEDPNVKWRLNNELPLLQRAYSIAKLAFEKKLKADDEQAGGNITSPKK